MRLRGFFGVAFALLSSAVFFYAAAWLKNPYGRECDFAVRVESEYYLYSPSSQAKIVERVGFAESFFLTGEKSVFCFLSEADAEKYASALLKEQGAAVVFEEECMGARSIYAFAPKRGGGIALSGKRVNLHLVVKGARVCVGTPIVFGGY